MRLHTFIKKGAIRANRSFTNAGLHGLSHFSKRDPSSWVFGAIFDEFYDNPKYLFLWIVKHHPEIRATWITGNRRTYEMLRSYGYPVEMRWSSAGIRRTLEAKLAIFCSYASDVNVALLGGAKLVNLWHGVGIKGVGHLSTLGTRSFVLRNAQNPLIRLAFLERFIAPDLFLSTSPAMTEHFGRCFRLPESRFFEAGYPRLDGAVDPELRAMATRTANVDDVIATKGSGKRVIVYMPTWRNTDRPFLEAAFPDIAKLDRILDRANAVLYIKLHRMTEDERIQALRQTSNIRFLPQRCDLYAVFSEIDCLITDYSSVLYDFIRVRNAGCVVYSFDEHQYFNQDQVMVAPFDENVLGARARTFDDLCHIIESGDAFGPLEPERLRALREKFWATSGSPASPRIVERLKRLAYSQ